MRKPDYKDLRLLHTVEKNPVLNKIVQDCCYCHFNEKPKEPDAKYHCSLFSRCDTENCRIKNTEYIYTHGKVLKGITDHELKEFAALRIMERFKKQMKEGATIGTEDIEFYSWPQVFSSTAGPRHAIGGQTMTTFQVYAFNCPYFAYIALYCAGIWKFVKANEFQLGMRFPE